MPANTVRDTAQGILLFGAILDLHCDLWSNICQIKEDTNWAPAAISHRIRCLHEAIESNKGTPSVFELNSQRVKLNLAEFPAPSDFFKAWCQFLFENRSWWQKILPESDFIFWNEQNDASEMWNGKDTAVLLSVTQKHMWEADFSQFFPSASSSSAGCL